MQKYANGTQLVLHSENGKDYDISVISYNPCREPSMAYAVDTYVNGEYVGNDVQFVSEEFLDLCEIVNN